MKKLSIAIDGYAASGKGETAKGLAQKLGYKRIDTGAMYRAVSLFLLRRNISLDDQTSISDAFKEMKIDFTYNATTQTSEVVLNGENIENEIRDIEVNKIVGKVAQNLSVREFLVKQQQVLGAQGGVIMDGRDIGSVVLPNAELKVLMIADAMTRAQRRHKQFIEKGKEISLEEVFSDIQDRDILDEKNMSKCPDQIVLDTTNMTIPEQIDRVFKKIILRRYENQK